MWDYIRSLRARVAAAANDSPSADQQKILEAFDQAVMECAPPSNRTKEFTYGLIYDALGWTPGWSTSNPMWDVLADVLLIANQQQVSSEDFLHVRRLLSQSGFNVVPPHEDFDWDEEDDD